MGLLDTTTFVENVKCIYNRIVKNSINSRKSEKKLKVEIENDVSTYNLTPKCGDQVVVARILLITGIAMFILTLVLFMVGLVLMVNSEYIQCTITSCNSMVMQPDSSGISLKPTLCEIYFPKFNTTKASVLSPQQVIDYTMKGECPINRYFPNEVDYSYDVFFFVAAAFGFFTLLLMIAFLGHMRNMYYKTKESEENKEEEEKKEKKLNVEKLKGSIAYSDIKESA